MKTVTSSAAACAALLSATSGVAGTLLATDASPDFSDGTAVVSTQYRNGQAGLRGADEIYVAPDGDAGNGNPRAGADFRWALDTAYAFSFSYDADGGFGGQGLLTSSLDGVSAVFGDSASETLASGLTFNTIKLNVEDRDNRDEVLSITELFVNGNAVTNMPLGIADSFTTYAISGFGIVSDFDITGILIRSGSQMGTQQSRPRVDIKVGTVEGASAPALPPAVIPLPAAGWLLLAAVGGMAAARGRRAV